MLDVKEHHASPSVWSASPLLSWVEARPLRYRPALVDPVELEAKIIMQSARSVLLDNKGERCTGFLVRCRGTRRLRRLPEIPFPSVFLEAEKPAAPPAIVSRRRALSRNKLRASPIRGRRRHAGRRHRR
jgi:hypothetical protein